MGVTRQHFYVNFKSGENEIKKENEVYAFVDLRQSFCDFFKFQMDFEACKLYSISSDKKDYTLFERYFYDVFLNFEWLLFDSKELDKEKAAFDFIINQFGRFIGEEEVIFINKIIFNLRIRKVREIKEAICKNFYIDWVNMVLGASKDYFRFSTKRKKGNKLALYVDEIKDSFIEEQNIEIRRASFEGHKSLECKIINNYLELFYYMVSYLADKNFEFYVCGKCLKPFYNLKSHSKYCEQCTEDGDKNIDELCIDVDYSGVELKDGLIYVFKFKVINQLQEVKKHFGNYGPTDIISGRIELLRDYTIVDDIYNYAIVLYLCRYGSVNLKRKEIESVLLKEVDINELEGYQDFFISRKSYLKLYNLKSDLIELQRQLLLNAFIRNKKLESYTLEQAFEISGTFDKEIKECISMLNENGFYDINCNLTLGEINKILDNELDFNKITDDRNKFNVVSIVKDINRHNQYKQWMSER